MVLIVGGTRPSIPFWKFGAASIASRVRAIAISAGGGLIISFGTSFRLVVLATFNAPGLVVAILGAMEERLASIALAYAASFFEFFDGHCEVVESCYFVYLIETWGLGKLNLEYGKGVPVFETSELGNPLNMKSPINKSLFEVISIVSLVEALHNNFNGSGFDRSNNVKTNVIVFELPGA